MNPEQHQAINSPVQQASLDHAFLTRLRDSSPPNLHFYPLHRARWTKRSLSYFDGAPLAPEGLDEARARTKAFRDAYGQTVDPWVEDMASRAKVHSLGKAYGMTENVLVHVDLSKVEERIAAYFAGCLMNAQPWAWLRSFVEPMRRHCEELCVWHLVRIRESAEGLNAWQLKIVSKCEFALRKVITLCRDRQLAAFKRRFDVRQPAPGSLYDVTVIKPRD